MSTSSYYNRKRFRLSTAESKSFRRTNYLTRFIAGGKLIKARDTHDTHLYTRRRTLCTFYALDALLDYNSSRASSVEPRLRNKVANRSSRLRLAFYCRLYSRDRPRTTGAAVARRDAGTPATPRFHSRCKLALNYSCGIYAAPPLSLPLSLYFSLRLPLSFFLDVSPGKTGNGATSRAKVNISSSNGESRESLFRIAPLLRGAELTVRNVKAC